MVMDFDWELVETEKRKKGPRNLSDKVWLTSRINKAGHEIVDKMHISFNLVDELCWSDGTRVNLFRSKSGKMFKMCADKVGLITLRQAGTRTWYQDVNLMLEFNVPANGKEFDAWVDGEDLVFKPVAK